MGKLISRKTSWETVKYEYAQELVRGGLLNAESNSIVQ